MPYPFSPFSENVDNNLIKTIPNAEENATVSQDRFVSTLSWLCTSPKISSYKVNTLKCSPSDVIKLMASNFSNNETANFNVSKPNITMHEDIPNVIIINNYLIDKDKIKRFTKEVVVDVECACAVLRGAHIYAPGVIGLSSGTQIGDPVSVYADIVGECKRGFQKLYDTEKKIFIGNGVAAMQRHQLFRQDLKPSGVSIRMSETISGCPSMDNQLIPPGLALLQNLPSIICIMALDPQPGETVIDMCASPGNKTIHIAELMDNKGLLVAIDKTPHKVNILREKCATFGANMVRIFQADSTKIVISPIEGSGVTGPPFAEESFDRILLDAPCSVLGKRPQLANRMSSKEITSFVPLQRKLINAAIRLLKPNGILVYSTCTITLAENEGIVAWTLKNFRNMKLTTPKLFLGESGWPGAGLTADELGKVQRFGPESSVDSVGFFFCVFRKEVV